MQCGRAALLLLSHCYPTMPSAVWLNTRCTRSQMIDLTSLTFTFPCFDSNPSTELIKGRTPYLPKASVTHLRLNTCTGWTCHTSLFLNTMTVVSVLQCCNLFHNTRLLLYSCRYGYVSNKYGSTYLDGNQQQIIFYYFFLNGSSGQVMLLFISGQREKLKSGLVVSFHMRISVSNSNGGI